METLERCFIALMWAIIILVIIGAVKTALNDERFVGAVVTKEKKEVGKTYIPREPLFPEFNRARRLVTSPEEIELLIVALRPQVLHLEAIAPKETDREFLISILRIQESQGNPHAIGDKGKAYGCLQIHKCVVIDVNRHFGTSYRHNDILGNPKLADEICLKYWQIYASPNASFEELARLWNGGPDWRKDPTTVTYWKKVTSLI